MGGPVELKGPDLTAGINVADVPDGGCVLGHAHGEPVMIVRRSDELFAVGATCTHYSGPLSEGLVVGDTVRCPWHHACFDLRTGAPSAPAFTPIPCYRLVRRGETLTVGDKLSPPEAQPQPEPRRVVIVGAGPAGAMAAEALRRFGHSGSITLVGAEATPPVDRTNLSKDYLAGTAPEEWMLLRDEGFYREQNIDLRLGTRVVRIDQSARDLELEGGERLAWDALVLATGAEPVVLKLPGAERIHTLRTLADSRGIIEKAEHAKRAVVVGASFIGLEVAASLRARELDVSVVGLEHLPLERVLGRAVAELVQDVHEQHGVKFYLGHSLASVDQDGVTLDDGRRLAADLVVAGVGVRPRTELAENAGLKVERGILVDDRFCAAPGIYAIGDAARFEDARTGARLRIEHWVVAQRQGEAVARSLLGKPVRRMPTPFFWSAHYDLTINYVGHAERWDRIDIDGDLAARDAAVHYYQGDRLLAVATLGRDHYALEVARRLELE